MKEKYIRPQVANFDAAENANGWVPVAGLLAGYAAARAVTKAMKAAPSRRLENLPKGKDEI